MGAWFRAHTVAVLVGAVVILVALIAAIVIGLNSGTPTGETITQVTYSQTQAGTKAAPAGVVVTSDAKIRAVTSQALWGG